VTFILITAIFKMAEVNAGGVRTLIAYMKSMSPKTYIYIPQLLIYMTHLLI